MTTIAQGKPAPLFSLRTTEGNTANLAQRLDAGSAVVAAFFKISCPVCQFAFPFLERIHRNYPAAAIWGISQDDIAETNDFARTYEISFPMLLDEHLASTVDYDLTNVPSTFLIKPDHTVELSIIGFGKADFEELNRRVADYAGVPLKPLFTEADEDIPALRPG
jgi:peroxiredoxin